MANRPKSAARYVEEDRGHSTPCWVWLRATNGIGYGIDSIKGKNVTAHAKSYELKYGQVPEGLELDHLCRIKLCINPDHLEAVTHAENIRRGKTAKLTPNDVEEIRRDYYAPGNRYGRYSAIALRYSVTPPTIRYLILGHTWKER